MTLRLVRRVSSPEGDANARIFNYAHVSAKHLQPYADQLIFPVTPGNGGKPAIPDSATRHKSGHSGVPSTLHLVVSNVS